MLVLTQFAGEPTGSGGTGFTLVSLSNGENGIDETRNAGGDPEFDEPNTTPISQVIQDQNGAGNKLENGDVIRFSAWMRLDPNDPLLSSPQVEPLIKVEAWKEFGASTQDTNPGLLAPQFGDKIFDQQQHALEIHALTQGTVDEFPAESLPQWVDLDADGQISEDEFADEQSRISTLTTEAWTLVETTYEIDDFFWLGIFDNNAGNPPDTTVIDALEEIRVTMFLGDFTFANGSPATLGGGNLLVDNILVELFPDMAAANATPNPNPDPILDETPFVVGDADGDGDVDGNDLIAVQVNFGSVDPLVGDADGDGDVDADDLVAVRTNFGVPQSAAVPEPTAAALAALAVAMAATRRARQ